MTSLFHIATASDWEHARRQGRYRTSTRGRSLAEVGFVHCARREQVPEVFRRHYADCTEALVLLTIDTDRLGAPWREETVGTEVYPHVYGSIPVSAVTDVSPLDPDGTWQDSTSLFLRAVLTRAAALVLVLLAGIVGLVIGALAGGATVQLLGLAVGLAVGIVASAVVLRRLGR